MTNWWDGLFRGHSLTEAGDIEHAQGIMLAKLASQVNTLEHYIWSTLPNGEKITEGRIPVPHFDYKARVDDYIKETLPELAAKTTFLMFGFYPSNLAFFSMLKPVPVVSRPLLSKHVVYLANETVDRTMLQENMFGCFQHLLPLFIRWLVT